MADSLHAFDRIIFIFCSNLSSYVPGLNVRIIQKPRELLWLFGVLIFLLLMAEAFFGYLLPWGQMSYWGAQVIVNLFATIPFIGPDLAEWVRGDYLISDATLNRFFAFHVIALPLALSRINFSTLIACMKWAQIIQME
jgi:ubiquinol-cytochrome c reductase cytochrome b subunit